MGLKPRQRWAGEGVGRRMDRRFLREGADFCSSVAPTLHSSYPSTTWTSKGLKQQYREFGGSESNHRMFVQLFQSAQKKSRLKNLALVEFLIQTEERSGGTFGAKGLPTPGACVHVRTLEWSVLVCCSSHLRSPSCHTITFIPKTKMLALVCFSEKKKVEETSYHLHCSSLGCWFNKYSFTGEKDAWVIFASRLFLSFETGDKPPSTKNKHWLNMNHINLFLKAAPPDTKLKRMQATHDKAVVWLSVAPHTVSGAHFHTICMIRLIGLVWKHFRGTVAEFLQPRQLEMRIEKWWNITGSDSLQACVCKGQLNRSQWVLVSSEAA